MIRNEMDSCKYVSSTMWVYCGSLAGQPFTVPGPKARSQRKHSDILLIATNPHTTQSILKQSGFQMVLRQDTVVMIDASAYVYSTQTYIYIYIIHICYMCFFDTGMHIYTVLSNSSNTAPFGQPSNTAFSDILLTQPSQHSFPWTAFLRQSSWQVF